MKTNTPSAPLLLSALARFVASRPGLDPRNYGNGLDGWRAYRAESASVSRDLRQARRLIRYCEQTLRGDAGRVGERP